MNKLPDAIQDFTNNGFLVTEPILNIDLCRTLQTQVWSQTRSGGNRNMLHESWCQQLAIKLREADTLATILPRNYGAIQCTYFEKSAETNWLVPIHQDLSIPVKRPIAHPLLKAWSIKNGEHFVQAPIEFIETLVAVRLHLDDCNEDDGPVAVIPGSHQLGRIDNEQALHLKRNTRIVNCLVKAGAALLMRPLLLHMSSKAHATSNRPVLHFVFAPERAPLELEYACFVR